MADLNVVVMGKTGVGKSTLINAVLLEERAPTKKTNEAAVYTTEIPQPFPDGGPAEGIAGLRTVALYDTVGLEIDPQTTQNTLDRIRGLLTDASGSNSPGERTLVWFCLSPGSHRLETYEIDLIKNLSITYDIPFFIILTQCSADEPEEMEKSIHECLPEIPIFRVLAKRRKYRNGTERPAFGVWELLRRSYSDYEKSKVRLLAEKLRSTEQDLAEKERKWEEHLRDIQEKAEQCVQDYSDKAILIGLVPVACIPVVHTMCAQMLHKLHVICGVSASGLGVELSIDAIVGLIVTPVMAIPVLSAAAATSYISTVGEDYVKALLDALRCSSSNDLKDGMLMMQRIKAALQKESAQ